MAVKIGHACIDENGKIHSGAAGDQTGREVCTRNWYAGGWTVLLRPKDPDVAEKMAKTCEAGCANNKIGYDQYQRNTLRKRARAAGWDLSKITTKCECDCSSFMAVCAEAAGVDMDGAYTSGNAPVTSNMRSKFKATGAFEVLTASKYLTRSGYLKRGDILVKEGTHTVMVLSNGSAVVSSTPAASDRNPSYTIGKTYTLQVELKVRTGPGTGYRAKKYEELTVDGRKHDADGDGALDKGTNVTCKAIEKDSAGNTWIQTPSGWLAAVYNGKTYIK